MRALSVSLSLAAAASLALASPCSVSSNTFNIIGANSLNSGINGWHVATGQDQNFALAQQSLPPYVIQPLHLEPGTDKLMVNSLYIGYSSSDEGLYPVEASEINEYGLVYLTCTQVTLGVPMSCSPQGYPDLTKFYVYGTFRSGNDAFFIRMYSPNSPDSSGWVTVDLIPQAA